MIDLKRVHARVTGAAAGAVLTIPLLADNVVKKIKIEGFIHLNTAAAKVPSIGALSDAPYTIIRDVYLDLGGKQRQKASGAIHRIVTFLKKKALPYHDTVAAPAAGASSTVRFSLPIYLSFPRAKDNPSMGMIDLKNFKRQANLVITLGDIANLFGTVNDTTITGIDIKIICHEIPGLVIAPTDQVYCEPVVLSYNVANSNDALAILLDSGDRDYQGILLYSESAVDTPDDGANVMTGSIHLDASTATTGNINLRAYDSWHEIKDDNQENEFGTAMPAGYAYIDFVGDDKVVSGAVGTKQMSTFKLTTSVTGAATNIMKVISLVTWR